jgi:hypothetical protein
MDGLRALDVMALLQERLAVLTGGRDRRGGPVLSFPATPRRERAKPDDYRRLLQYLLAIPWWVDSWVSNIAYCTWRTCAGTSCNLFWLLVRTNHTISLETPTSNRQTVVDILRFFVESEGHLNAYESQSLASVLFPSLVLCNTRNLKKVSGPEGL